MAERQCGYLVISSEKNSMETNRYRDRWKGSGEGVDLVPGFKTVTTLSMPDAFQLATDRKTRCELIRVTTV